MKLFRLSWQKSPSHLLFLTTFLRPRELGLQPTNIKWELILGESPQQTISRFQRSRAIRECSLSQLLAHRFSVNELRQLLQERGIPFTSNDRKNDLILYLVQNDEFGMSQAVEGVELWQCSDFGQQLAEQYLKDPGSVTGQKFTERQKSWLIEVLKFILAAGIGGVIENVSWQALLELLNSLLPMFGKIMHMSLRLEEYHEDRRSSIGQVVQILRDALKHIPETPHSSQLQRELTVAYQHAEILLSASDKLGQDRYFAIHHTDELVHTTHNALNTATEIKERLSYDLQKVSMILREEDISRLLDLRQTFDQRDIFLWEKSLHKAQERLKDLDQKFSSIHEIVHQAVALERLLSLLDHASHELANFERLGKTADLLERDYIQSVKENPSIDEDFLRNVLDTKE